MTATERLTPGFDRGSVVRVRFLYTDRDTRQRRPALVVSDGPLGEAGALLWVVMITSAENRSWPDDVSLVDTFAQCGLPAPSIIRPTKIATIEAAQADLIGNIPAAILTVVMNRISRTLGL